MTRISIPIRISGSLADPSVKPDVDDVIKQEVQDKAESLILDQLGLGGDKQEGEPESKENDLLEEAIRDLLKKHEKNTK